MIDLLPTLPFVVLLLAIAVLPLVPYTQHWWEHNENRLLLALVLSALTIGHYAWHGQAFPDRPSSPTVEPSPHDTPTVPEDHTGPSEHAGHRGHGVGEMLYHAVLAEYVPFMTLLFALYTICGGIRITGRMAPTPMFNTAVLAFGAVMASFVGTTGASMLLIRPLLEINAVRRRKVHTVLFFVFLVSNIGGSLLPIGDPPLFLGYLQGIPFLWTLRLWGPWLFCVATLLVLYFTLDSVLYRSEPSPDSAYPGTVGPPTAELPPRELPADPALEPHRRPSRRLTIDGASNLFWLLLVVVTVATIDGGPEPSRPLPLGPDWVTPPFLREVALLGLTWVSWAGTDPLIRRANGFSFAAIVEVAALFIGIFITMQPALELLQHRGGELGLSSPRQFFWATGLLSSVLDNAPTYAVFLATAKTLHGGDLSALHSGAGEPLLVGVSLGAVFLGAMTYIGNGPNFMVKSIAEQAGVEMPSFFGYVVYSSAILVPIFVVMSYIFLNGHVTLRSTS